MLIVLQIVVAQLIVFSLYCYIHCNVDPFQCSVSLPSIATHLTMSQPSVITSLEVQTLHIILCRHWLYNIIIILCNLHVYVCARLLPSVAFAILLTFLQIIHCKLLLVKIFALCVRLQNVVQSLLCYCHVRDS